VLTPALSLLGTYPNGCGGALSQLPERDLNERRNQHGIDLRGAMENLRRDRNGELNNFRFHFREICLACVFKRRYGGRNLRLLQLDTTFIFVTQCFLGLRRGSRTFRGDTLRQLLFCEADLRFDWFGPIASRLRRL